MQALAYLPEKDVIDGFLWLKKNIQPNFEPMLNYLERIYIGKLRKGSKTARLEPRYPIPSWNLHNRVLNKLPRTNNAIESWHSRLKAEQKREMTLNKLVGLLRDEQANTDTTVLSLNLGNRKKRPKASIVKDENLYNLCSEYKKKDMEKFLNFVSLNMRLDLIPAKEIDSDYDSESESDAEE